MTTPPPSRNPHFCGAIGRPDRNVLERMAAALGAPVDAIHHDDRSVVLLDRTPLRWRSLRSRGVAWSETDAPPSGRIRSWQDAATAGNAAGFAAQGKRRFLHTSVSGLTNVYVAEHDGTTYFASRIHALASALPGPLTPDWEAWAAILAMRFPIGDSTPFAEIRRLPPFATYEDGRIRTHDWPWAQVPGTADLQDGIEPLVESLRESVSHLDRATALLSGGLDSRIFTALLADSPAEVEALTLVYDDGGRRREHELAAQVAERLGVPHRIVGRDPNGYWDEWLHRARSSDFQLGGRAWLTSDLAVSGAPVIHGLVLDTFSARGGRFYSKEVFSEHGKKAARSLFRSLRHKTARNVVDTAFAPEVAKPVSKSARKQFVKAGKPYRGHPNEVLLLFYATRTVRGMGLFPHQVMGANSRVLIPAATDRVARRLLAIDPVQKLDFALYDEMLARTAKPVADLRTSAQDSGYDAPTEEQTCFHPSVIANYERLLPESPLAPVIEPDLLAAARGGRLDGIIRTPAVHRAVIALALFTEWHRTYADRLGDVDPRALADIA